MNLHENEKEFWYQQKLNNYTIKFLYNLLIIHLNYLFKFTNSVESEQLFENIFFLYIFLLGGDSNFQI